MTPNIDHNPSVDISLFVWMVSILGYAGGPLKQPTIYPLTYTDISTVELMAVCAGGSLIQPDIDPLTLNTDPLLPVTPNIDHHPSVDTLFFV